MVAGAMGMDSQKALDFLAPDPGTAGWSAAELRSFAAHGMKPPPRR